MNADYAPVMLGLASAAAWGAGDFCGGLATKRAPVYGVVIISQIVGVILLVGSALSLGEKLPPPTDLLWGGVAGLGGGLGLVALYSALASGRMGVAAPVSAVIAAAIPVAFGALAEGLPRVWQVIGFALALAAVWLISRSGEAAVRARDLGLPLAAGFGFGLFFIALDRASGEGVLWPIVAARLTSAAALMGIATLRRPSSMPTLEHLPLIALSGLFDTGGNAFYALAAQAGRLDVAAVLGSLYPASTVLLAALILKERISRMQSLGIVAALAAIVLIAG